MQKIPPLKIVAQIADDLKLKVQNVQRWETIKRHFKGMQIILTVEQWTDSRTTRQNNLYWVYLGVIESETGTDANDLHTFFKHKFIPTKFVTVMGEEIAAEKTTTRMDKLEFIEYMNKIELLTGVPVPNLEEYLYGK